MTVMVAVPAVVVMVIRMSDSNHNLGARRRYQRSEEHQSEKAKTKFLHTYSDAQPMRQVVALYRRIVVIAYARPDVK